MYSHCWVGFIEWLWQRIKLKAASRGAGSSLNCNRMITSNINVPRIKICVLLLRPPPAELPGQCQHLHGHNARAVITRESSELDERGMVMDFSEVKQLVWAWIDREIDLTLLLHRDGMIRYCHCCRKPANESGLPRRIRRPKRSPG